MILISIAGLRALLDLDVNAGVLTPEFSWNYFDYDVLVSSSVSSIRFVPNTTENTNVRINNQLVSSFSLSSAYSLNSGNNSFVLTVFDELNTLVGTYNVIVKRLCKNINMIKH